MRSAPPSVLRTPAELAPPSHATLSLLSHKTVECPTSGVYILMIVSLLLAYFSFFYYYCLVFYPSRSSEVCDRRPLPCFYYEAERAYESRVRERSISSLRAADSPTSFRSRCKRDFAPLFIFCDNLGRIFVKSLFPLLISVLYHLAEFCFLFKMSMIFYFRPSHNLRGKL